MRTALIILLALVLAPATAVATEGAWVDAAPIPTERGGGAITAQLNDGSILFAGGSYGAYELATAERFDPVTNRWSWVPPMPSVRAGAPAVVFPNGRVLIAGGRTTWIDPTTTAVVFDPEADNWLPAEPMAHTRAFHDAVLLDDGRVLAVGVDGVWAYLATAVAELYDPETGGWTATGPMHAIRSDAAVTRLADGRVLVAGGAHGQAAMSVEIFDPETDSWSLAAPMHEPRSLAQAALLPDGRVLVAGGYDYDVVWSEPRGAEIYDPETDSWTRAAELSVPRVGATLVTLADGRPALVGGYHRIEGDVPSAFSATLEIYDYERDSWTLSPPMNDAEGAGDDAFVLADGSVLVERRDGTRFERFLPWATPTPTPTPVASASPTPSVTPEPTSPPIRTPVAVPTAVATPTPTATVVLGPAAGPVTNRVGRASFGAVPRRLTVSRAGAVAVKVRCSRAGACTDTLVLRVRGGGKVLARAKVALPAGRTGSVRLKLSKASRGALARRGTKATLTLSRRGASVNVSVRRAA